MTRKLVGPQAEAAAKRAAKPRKPRAKKVPFVDVPITTEPEILPLDLDSVSNATLEIPRSVVEHILPERPPEEVPPDPVIPPRAGLRFGFVETWGLDRVPVGGRPHLEVEAARADLVDPTGAVVRLLVRRGQDGPAAKASLLERGAAYVHVAPVPEDRVAELPAREVLLTDPFAALREYAKRDPPPVGTDLVALCREAFDAG